MSALKKTILNLFLACFIFIVTLAACDLFLQRYLAIPSRYLRQIVVFDENSSPQKRIGPQLDKQLMGAYREFVFHVTSSKEGFRNNQRGVSRSPSAHPVILIGDSQTFGIGVDDHQTISAQLSGKIGRDVLNAACPGYSNVEEWLLAKELLANNKPEILIVALFLGNDPYENSRHVEMLEDRGVSRRSTPNSRSSKGISLASLKEYFSKRSALYQFMILIRQNPLLNKLYYRMNLANETAPEELQIFNEPISEKGSLFFKLTQETILKIAELAKKSNTRFILMILPDRYQVDASYWKQWLTKYRFDPGQYDLKAPNSVIEEFCRREGLECVDALPALLKAQEMDSRPLYWKIDNHLAARGNEVIASHLAEYLNQAAVSA